MPEADHNLAPLTPEVAQRLLDRIAPGCTLSSVAEMRGSFSNSTCLVEGATPTGLPVRFVARRYSGGWSDPGRRARVEFHALGVAAAQGIPVARPLLLDSDGHLLGTPGIVVSFIEGEQLIVRGDRRWTQELARTLATIHAALCKGDEILLDANDEALYFIHSGEMTDVMRRDPDGERVWNAVMRHRGRLKPVQPGLVHLDFWTGNLLWRYGRIVGVVDWEEASCGDPAIDVAYLRRDLWGLGMRREADWLVEDYEAITGQPIANLPFWELAAAVRSMPSPADGVTELHALGIKDRTRDDLTRAHREFIAHALDRIG